MAQNDDFQEVMRCKRHIPNDTSQTAKKFTKPVLTSAAIKLPPKAALTCNFFTSLRTTDKDTRLLEQRMHYQSRRLPGNQGDQHQ
jgi:hypothetical protein